MVIVTLSISLVVMAFELVGPDLVFALMSSIFMAAGIISTKDGASGFSNTGVLTVLALFVVAEGVAQTGGELIGAHSTCCQMPFWRRFT